MATDIFTTVEINGESYSIKKFDAKSGLKIARLVIAKMAPLIPLIDPENRTADDALYTILGEAFDSLSDQDIDAIVDKCLRVCYANLPAGRAPIIDVTGNYGVEGVEYDLPLTLRLCFEAIKWGASDFFDENSSGLKGIAARLGLSQNQ